MKSFFRKFLAGGVVIPLFITIIGSMAGTLQQAKAAETKSIKILAIGNSFSVDGMHYIYQIAEDLGYEEIILGNLFLPGCSLETHAENAKNNNAYFYEKNTDGTWTSATFRTIKEALQEEDWDIITMQQVSSLSGIPETYNDDIDTLIKHVNENKTNPDAKLYWHMTWAYQQDSTHADFPKYNKDQMTMYNAIIDTVKAKIATNDEFDGIIPAGTAIQNVRTSHFGDTLTRDGYHLSLDLGRFIASVTWFAELTGESIDNLSFVPNNDPLIASNLPLIKEAVNAAVKEPFKVTESTYKTFELDLSNYEKIDWKPVPCSYWNSQAGIYRLDKNNSTALNLKYFICSENMFTKEDLPVGSIILVEPGYKYRADAWKNLGVQSSRPDFVSMQYTFVSEAWWEGYKYRAFNLTNSSVDLDVTNIADEVADKLSIYVPKSDAPKSNDNAIRGFRVGNVSGKITGNDIELRFPEGTVLTSVIPDILFSIKADISPGLGTAIDLTKPVEYTVTAEDGSTRIYTVKAAQAIPSPSPEPAETPEPSAPPKPIETSAEPTEPPVSAETPVDSPNTSDSVNVVLLGILLVISAIITKRCLTQNQVW